MPDLVHFSRQEEIAVITVDNPPVNALGPDVAEGMADAIGRAEADPGISAIILIGAGNTFIAGADIREFGKIVAGTRPKLDLNSKLAVIEDAAKPVIVAIRGLALGGGLETAMCGHYRVIAPDAQVGQPEIKLGLIPGAGGTQRLPRLAGVTKALEMCSLGEPISAAEAVSAGIADKLIEGDLLAGAIAFAREIAGQPHRKTRERAEKLRERVDTDVFEQARKTVRQRRRGEEAPLAAIDAVEAATRLPFAQGLQREAELFDVCLHSTQSKALIYAFFGERAVAKIPDLDATIKPRQIRRAAVVGAGTMGSAIAMTYANAGIPVLLKETTAEALERGMAAIRKNYAATVAKGRLTQSSMHERLARITPQLGYDGFEQADIITEAVFESMEVKKRLWAEVDRVAKPGCVLASNTSSLDIDEIASATQRPQDFIGTHFFSPAHVMRLLEVVRGAQTSGEVIATAMALGKKLGKVAVLARNARGFIGNRMIGPYLREAQFLVEEGASVEQVNDALYRFGMAMGPLAVDDLSGLDIGYAIRQEFAKFEKPEGRRPLVADLLVEAGRLGQKTGRGWSRYGADRKPMPDEDTAQLIEKTAINAGIKRRRIEDEEIVERCIYALVNEGAKLLQEGVALRAVDIDMTYLFGYGFPGWRGGPMFYADTIGLVLARIEDFAKDHGEDLWQPAPLLRELAESGKTFAG